MSAPGAVVKTSKSVSRKHSLKERTTTGSVYSTLNERVGGVRMKGGSPSDTTVNFVTPKGIKRMPNGEVRKRCVMASLHNLGNTCFMNSVLQVLYRTPDFFAGVSLLGTEIKSTMLAINLLQQLNYEGLKGTNHVRWVLVSRLDELLKQMKAIEDDFARGNVVRFPALRPYSLIESLEEINTEFHYNQQQDAHELLKCLLTNIEETTNELNHYRSRVKACISGPPGAINKTKVTNATCKDSLLIDELSTSITSTTKGNSSSLLVFDELTDENNFFVPNLRNYQLDKMEEAALNPSSKVVRHVAVDDEISIKIKPVKVPGSQVSFIPCEEFQLHLQQEKVFRDVSILLYRVDSILGMQHLNIGTGKISNLVTDLFQGYMVLKTRCLGCKKETERKEEFQDISLPIRRKSSNSNEDSSCNDDHVDVLQLILSILDEVEQLDGENCYSCDSCQSLVKAERRMCYELLPDILTIHLKRFASSFCGSFTKTFDSVHIPVELPCLESSCRNQKQPCHRYQLYGIVSHRGKSLVCGHYTAYVRVFPVDLMGSKGSLMNQDFSLSNSQFDVESAKTPRLDCCSKSLVSPECTYSEMGDCNKSKNERMQQSKRSPATRQSQSASGSELTTSLRPTSRVAAANTGSEKSRTRKIETRDVGEAESQSNGDHNLSTSMELDSALFTDNGSLWYQCNDDVVTELSKQQLTSLLKASGNNTPYMLFYRKVAIANDRKSSQKLF